MLDNAYVQASGYAARGWSKLVLVENGTRDLTGAIQDFTKAADAAGLREVLKATHNIIGAGLATLDGPQPIFDAPPLT